MTYYINSSEKILLCVAADGSEDSFVTDGFNLANDDEVAAFRAAQDAENAPTPEQILAAANSEIGSLLASAGLRVAPLQDAVDLGTETDDEKSSLLLWKAYRVAVARVKDQPGFPVAIDWPVPPGDA